MSKKTSTRQEPLTRDMFLTLLEGAIQLNSAEIRKEKTRMRARGQLGISLEMESMLIQELQLELTHIAATTMSDDYFDHVTTNILNRLGVGTIEGLEIK